MANSLLFKQQGTYGLWTDPMVNREDLPPKDSVRLNFLLRSLQTVAPSRLLRGMTRKVTFGEYRLQEVIRKS